MTSARPVFGRFVGFVGDPPEHEKDKIPCLRFDDGAQEYFDAWRAHLEQRLRVTDEHPVIVAHLAKYRSLLPSLSLIFHLCDSLPDVPVTHEAVQLAAQWCTYLEAHARRIYSIVIERTETATRLLGEKIRAGRLSATFTARDVYRKEWTGLANPNDVNHALEALEDLKWIRSKTIPSASAGGRPSTTYQVNPRLTEQKTRADMPTPPTDKTDETGFVGSVGEQRAAPFDDGDVLA